MSFVREVRSVVSHAMSLLVTVRFVFHFALVIA
jgi:hypothetical protein